MSITMTQLAARAKATLGTVAGSQAAALKALCDLQFTSYMLFQQEQLRLEQLGQDPESQPIQELKDRQVEIAKTLGELLSQVEKESMAVLSYEPDTTMLVQGRVYDQERRGFQFLTLSFQDDTSTELTTLGTVTTDKYGYYAKVLPESTVSPITTTNISLVFTAHDTVSDIQKQVCSIPIPKEQFVAGAEITREFLLDREIFENAFSDSWKVPAWTINGMLTENAESPTGTFKVKILDKDNDIVRGDVVSAPATGLYSVVYQPEPVDMLSIGSDVYINVYTDDGNETLLHSGKTATPPVYIQYQPGATVTPATIDVGAS